MFCRVDALQRMWDNCTKSTNFWKYLLGHTSFNRSYHNPPYYICVSAVLRVNCLGIYSSFKRVFFTFSSFTIFLKFNTLKLKGLVIHHQLGLQNKVCEVKVLFDMEGGRWGIGVIQSPILYSNFILQKVFCHEFNKQ